MKAEPAPRGTALVVRGNDAPNPWDDVRLQRLWLGIEKREWRSLAVIGSSPGIETIHVADLLAQLAWRYRGQPSSVCDLRDLSMRLIDYQVQEMRSQIDAGTRLVVSLRSIFENPTASPIAKQTDAVLLCVALGQSDFKAADETLADIGRDRVIGSLVLRPRAPHKRTNGT